MAADVSGEIAGVSSSQDDKTNTGQEGIAPKVAQHYNKLEETGLEKRTQSRIFYMRNFNNWIKSMAIGDILNKVRHTQGSDASVNVLDLCSGKGGDLLKWRKGKIDKLVCADIAGTSVEQCESRYKDMVERAKRERFPQKMFKAQFITADCSKQRLKDLYSDPDLKFDLVSCQFSFHYSFESFKQADMMLQNACECLKPGGYFIGTTPNANELVKRLQASEDMSFGSEVYKVTFKTEDKVKLPLFGAEYNFQLEGVVDCPEFLVYFPLLEKMAEKYGMKLVYRKPFAEYFQETVSQGEGRALIGKMQALEPYPPEEDVELLSKEEGAYEAARAFLQQVSQEPSQEGDTHRRRRPPKVGTLSDAEWKAITIYLVFAFQKQGVEKAVEQEAHRGTKRAREGPSRDETEPKKKQPHAAPSGEKEQSERTEVS